MITLSWRPSEGIKRLAVFCGLVGAGFGFYRFEPKIWQDVSQPFWRHAYYEQSARLYGASTEKDEDGNPILVVVRSSGLSAPIDFSKADDQGPWDVVSYSDIPKGFEVEKAIPPPPAGYTLEPDSASGKEFLLTRGDLAWVPTPIRLKAHPTGTVVYFKRFEKDAATEPGVVAWLSYCRTAVPLIGGFVIAAAFILFSGWVVDGFREPGKDNGA